jgi:cytosine/creatinine deaminase
LKRIIPGVSLVDRAGWFDIALDAERVSAITPARPGVSPRWLAMPALVNMHAHANRAFAAPSSRPNSLDDAVRAVKEDLATAARETFKTRAQLLFQKSTEHGVARVRTHTDVDAIMGMRAIEGVLEAAGKCSAELDVEVVAFANSREDPARSSTRELLTEAVRSGASLIGAVPAYCADPLASIDAMLNLASELDVGVDVHLDEHLDLQKALIEHLVQATLDRGLQGRLSVSHASALSVMQSDDAKRLCDRMAAAHAILVALPALNLFLQDRQSCLPRERGIAPVKMAQAAGVEARFGTDNVRDWFFPYGDADMLESAFLGALGSHIDSATALAALVCGGRRRIEVGDIADIVLVPATSLDDAIARRPAGRVLLRKGCPVGGGRMRAGSSHDVLFVQRGK